MRSTSAGRRRGGCFSGGGVFFLGHLAPSGHAGNSSAGDGAPDLDQGMERPGCGRHALRLALARQSWPGRAGRERERPARAKALCRWWTSAFLPGSPALTACKGGYGRFAPEASCSMLAAPNSMLPGFFLVNEAPVAIRAIHPVAIIGNMQPHPRMAQWAEIGIAADLARGDVSCFGRIDDHAGSSVLTDAIAWHRAMIVIPRAFASRAIWSSVRIGAPVALPRYRDPVRSRPTCPMPEPRGAKFLEAGQALHGARGANSSEAGCRSEK